MDLWYPSDDEAPLLEWWLPLLHASAAARRERVPWPIHFDDFRLRGRVDRDGRPAIWVYHRDSDQELYVDGTGQPYKFIRTPRARSHGRFTKLDIRSAILAAGLPRLVEPVWHDEPPRGHGFVEPTLPLGDHGAWPDDSVDPAAYVSERTRHAAPPAPVGAPRRRARAADRARARRAATSPWSRAAGRRAEPSYVSRAT